MKVLKFLVQIECGESTRWFLRGDQVAHKLELLVNSLLTCWTEGAKPRVTVIEDEKFLEEAP